MELCRNTKTSQQSPEVYPNIQWNFSYKIYNKVNNKVIIKFIIKFQISDGNGYSINDREYQLLVTEKSSYSSPSTGAARLNTA